MDAVPVVPLVDPTRHHYPPLLPSLRVLADNLLVETVLFGPEEVVYLVVLRDLFLGFSLVLHAVD